MGFGRRGAAAILALLMMGVGAGASGTPRPEEPAEHLRQRLARLLRQTRSVSWVQTNWERKGDREQSVRSKCLWTAGGVLRMEVEEGRGAGTRLVKRGDRVTIRPPGLFSALTLHKDVGDSLLKSLRGNDLRRAGFLPELEHVLAHWSQVELERVGTEIRLRYPNAQRLPAQLSLELESLAPSAIEASEGGVVVERTTFDQVRFGVAVDPENLAP